MYIHVHVEGYFQGTKFCEKSDQSYNVELGILIPSSKFCAGTPHLKVDDVIRRAYY